MLSALVQAWSLLKQGLGLDYKTIADILERWNDSGELHGNYILKIAVDMLRTKKSGNGIYYYVLDKVLDKVMQDDDNTEGTLHWTIEKSANRHVPTPTLAAGHFLRIASGNRVERLEVARTIQSPKPCLFCQGLEQVQRASDDQEWGISLFGCLRISRGSCIIRFDDN